jgi:hypothetical protein
MTDESLIRHKTYTIRLMSYQRQGDWVPLALVSSPGQREEEGHPVSGEAIQALRTRDAADAVAKKLAIEWIDSQCPSAAD